MSDVVIKGVDGMIEQPGDLDWDSEQGAQSVRVFTGPKAHAIQTANDLIVTGAQSVSIKYDFQTATVTASYPGQTGGGAPLPVSEEWELTWQDVQKDIASYPGFTLQMIKEVEMDLANGAMNIKYGDAAKSKYRNFRVTGTDSFEVSLPIITMTKMTTKYNTIKENFGDAQEVVQYINIGVPTTAKFEEPQVYFPDGLGNFVWYKCEYLTKPSNIRWNKQSRMYQITKSWKGVPLIDEIAGSDSGSEVVAINTKGGWSGTLYHKGSGKP